MKQHGVVFDLDGTLLDTSPQIYSILENSLSQRGLVVPSWDSFQQVVGLPLPEMFERFLIPRSLISELTSEFRTDLSDLIESGTSAFAGAVETLDRLFSIGYEVGVATNKPTQLAKKTIACSVLKNFPLYVQGTENFPPKPNPQILKHLQVNFFNTKIQVMIGDRKEDVYTGLNFGIATVGLAQTYHTESDLEIAGADLVFPNFLEMFESFEKFRELIDRVR